MVDKAEARSQHASLTCLTPGILFVEADADVSMDQLADTIQPPCPYIDELLHDVPGSSDILGCPLLLIQVDKRVHGKPYYNEIKRFLLPFDCNLTC